jgi:hypothetical protein
MLRARLSLAGVLALASGSVAQVDHVVPTAYAATAGNGAFTGQLANAARTYQWLIHSDQLVDLVGADITALTVRLPASAATAYPAADATFSAYDIRISPGVEPAARSLTFANNVVGTQQLVRSGALVIPAASFTVGSSPNAFGHTINFDTPYSYGGGHLLVEIRHNGSTSTSQSVDALTTSTPGYLTQFAACWTGSYTGVSGSAANFGVMRLTASGGAPTGRCCKTDGSCLISTANGCTVQGGTYGGDGTNCTPNPCPQPPTGACCLFASCNILTQANCTSQGGTYQGDNSVCASCPPIPPVFYANCNISTGPTTLSGVAAPAGFLWSECAKDDVEPNLTNTTAGFTGTGTFRMADDFVIPAGGMNVAYVKVYAYHSSATPTLATGATLRILDGAPTGTPGVVFGDQTTNRMANVAFTNIYRIFPTTVGLGSGTPCVNGAPSASGTTRRLQEIYITVNQFLPAGTYWIDYGLLHAATMFVPPATQADAIGRQCNPNNSNGLQGNSNVWTPAFDGGHGCVNGVAVNNPAGTNPINVQQDLYFEVLGTPGTVPCYADCDGVGGLTANDFACFLSAYVNGQSYADCDGVGGLTANDFICFLTAYNGGCS